MPLPAYEKLGAFYLGRKVDDKNGKDTDELVMYDARDLTTAIARCAVTRQSRRA